MGVSRCHRVPAADARRFARCLTTYPKRIVSGGQTGADRGGLAAAVRLGIAHGGWCPRGRRAEDGRVPNRYALTETASASYQVRTRRNVLDSDGTLIFTRGRLEGGSLLTARIARDAGKPCLHLDLKRLGGNRASAVVQLRAWLLEHRIATLNVAGSRESKARGIQEAVRAFLCEALGRRRPDAVARTPTVALQVPHRAAEAGEPSYGSGRNQRPADHT